jgi:aquaporin Z
MEAAGLGTFMVSACVFGAFFWHPHSPASGFVADGVGRRALMGLAMGLTAVGLIYSPWGQQSGAHMNPSVTLTFLRLGKVQPADAFFYVLAQFAGGLAGVLLSRLLLGRALAHPSVNYVATVPGASGHVVAFGAEAAIAFVLMLTVLVEAPLSGMSMNPARSFSSALPAMTWTAFWVYLTAPLLGMLLAAEVYAAARDARAVHCAKLHHQNRRRCIFCQGAPAIDPA